MRLLYVSKGPRTTVPRAPTRNGRTRTRVLPFESDLLRAKSPVNTVKADEKAQELIDRASKVLESFKQFEASAPPAPPGAAPSPLPTPPAAWVASVDEAKARAAAAATKEAPKKGAPKRAASPKGRPKSPGPSGRPKSPGPTSRSKSPGPSARSSSPGAGPNPLGPSPGAGPDDGSPFSSSFASPWGGGGGGGGPAAKKKAPSAPSGGGVAVKERPKSSLSLKFESEAKAKEGDAPSGPLASAVRLFSSVFDLTTAITPPTRGEPAEVRMPSFLELRPDVDPQDPAAAGAPPVAMPSASDLIRGLEGTSGVLADGSTWEKEQGEEHGPNGYWKRYYTVRGVTQSFDDLGKPLTLHWEESWWEASDWSGHRQMGARKAGSRTRPADPIEGTEEAKVAAWEEFWEETLGREVSTGAPKVERKAEKKAWDEGQAESWNEAWYETYSATGKADRYAEKICDRWGAGEKWGEKWGEAWDGQGGASKWADKWGSRGMERWGDKWEQAFKNGRGYRKGEAWNGWGDDNSAPHYQRWWEENHHGGGHVQKTGRSTTGEQWDSGDQSGTYYEEQPHNGGFHQAVRHSPQLLAVAEWPRDRTAPQPGTGGGGSGANNGGDFGGMDDFL